MIWFPEKLDCKSDASIRNAEQKRWLILSSYLPNVRYKIQTYKCAISWATVIEDVKPRSLIIEQLTERHMPFQRAKPWKIEDMMFSLLQIEKRFEVSENSYSPSYEDSFRKKISHLLLQNHSCEKIENFELVWFCRLKKIKKYLCSAWQVLSVPCQE